MFGIDKPGEQNADSHSHMPPPPDPSLSIQTVNTITLTQTSDADTPTQTASTGTLTEQPLAIIEGLRKVQDPELAPQPQLWRLAVLRFQHYKNLGGERAERVLHLLMLLPCDRA